MTTLSAAEMFWIILCALGFVAGCVGVYATELALAVALKALEKQPADLEIQARVRIATDGVRSALTKTTVLFCFLLIGIVAAERPAPPAPVAPVPPFVLAGPLALIAAALVLTADAYLEWRSRAELSVLIRAIKAQGDAPSPGRGP